MSLALGAANLQAHEPGESTSNHTIKVPAASAPTPLVSSPSIEGTWAALPFLMPINPIHVSLMHTGKVLVVSGYENEYGNYQIGEYFGGVYDPIAGTVETQLIPWDVFYTGLAFDRADGQSAHSFELGSPADRQSLRLGRVLPR